MASPNSVDPLGWTRDYTPILRSFANTYREDQPFAGYSVAVASHLEAKTGILIETLNEAGAEVLVTSSEPYSTQEAVISALADRDGIRTYVAPGMSETEWTEGQHALLEDEPDIILDDACELIAKIHADHPEIAETVLGGAEQTTAGITRLEAMDAEGALAFPVYGVNDTPMKHHFDNVHGTGESALSNIQLTTNTLIAGATIVIAGYGYVGRGVAQKARSLGAQTIVTEVDPRRALEAHMDGHRILAMTEAAEYGDYFITTTGNREILRQEHFERMQDGAILANAGHFDVEISLDDLDAVADHTTTPRDGVTRYHLPDGRRLNLLADGRLVNLTGPYSQGHPAEVMDMTFAMMFIAAYDLLSTGGELSAGLHAIPDRLDRQVAERKLETLGISIDALTDRQQAYLDDWEHPDMNF